MSRHRRRAAVAEARQNSSRSTALKAAMDYLRQAPATAEGATLFMPDGETMFVSRETADAMAPPVQSYAEQMTSIHQEAAGLMNLDIVLRDDMVAMVSAAALGNLEAVKMHQRVNGALLGMLKASADAPKLCATCPETLGGGRFSLALATPACDDPTNTLALAICHTCATTRDDVRTKATEALRRIWPDARRVTVTHPAGGRA